MIKMKNAQLMIDFFLKRIEYFLFIINFDIILISKLKN